MPRNSEFHDVVPGSSDLDRGLQEAGKEAPGVPYLGPGTVDNVEAMTPTAPDPVQGVDLPPVIVPTIETPSSHPDGRVPETHPITEPPPLEDAPHVPVSPAVPVAAPQGPPNSTPPGVAPSRGGSKGTPLL